MMSYTTYPLALHGEAELSFGQGTHPGSDRNLEVQYTLWGRNYGI